MTTYRIDKNGNVVFDGIPTEREIKDALLERPGVQFATGTLLGGQTERPEMWQGSLVQFFIDLFTWSNE